MTKMTKEAAKELLTNRKVYVNGKSREIQEKLFECGYKWRSGAVTIKETDSPFLMIKDWIAQNDSMNWFKNHPFKEITAKEILSIEIEEGFKDGDFVYCWIHGIIAIYNSANENNAVRYHACLIDGKLTTVKPATIGIGYVSEYKPASPEQRQLLINELAKIGKRWNADKKCIEDIPSEPKELKPFDRVLVRDTDGDIWRCEIFSSITEDIYPFMCVGNNWRQCIPYEGNEYLVGITKNPND